jgi:phage-related baseplate assembly protein
MNEKKGKLKTKKIHSDVKYYLSGSSKYNEAIKDYSINNNSNFIAFILLDENDNNNDDINNMCNVLDNLGGIRVDNNEINNNYNDNNDKDKIDNILKVTFIFNL